MHSTGILGITMARKKTTRSKRTLPTPRFPWRDKALGAAIAVFAVSGLASLAGYNAYDPSLHTLHTNNDGVTNLLGFYGSYLSDALLQSLGLSAFALMALLLGWAALLFMKEGFRLSLRRILTGLIAIIGFGLILAPFMAEDIRGYVGSFGGNVGVIIYNLIGLVNSKLFGNTYGWVAAIIGAVMMILGLRFSLPWQFVDIKALFERTETEEEETEEEEDEDYEPSYGGDEPEVVMPVLPKSAEKRVARKEKKKPAQPKLALDGEEPNYSNWNLPDPELLQEPKRQDSDPVDEKALQRNAQILQNVLADFNVQGQITRVSPGPVVTLYELEPAPGIKSSRVIGLADDIARSMSATSVRAAVVPGKNVIGIEMPNRKRQTVYMREMVTDDSYQNSAIKLPLVLGKDISGAPVMTDLSRMPHLLVAGTTGSGKSVAINTMILSLVYKLSPAECRFIMIDPKMLELSVYDGIPHLLSPVVTEPGKAVVALKWTVREMEDRYRDMSKLGVRNIDGYNQRVREARGKGEVIMRKIQTGFDPDTGKPVYEEQPLDLTELPYIVVIVDEFADLMLVAGKDVEGAVQRLAQMARAAGIHLIMATQRPSVDVITGTIKANFPTRISFAVTSKIDSRTILGEGGAEQLLGQGDMLYMAAGGKITRVHGPFVSDKDVEEVVNHLKAQGEPSYVTEVTEVEDSEQGAFGGMGGGGDGGDDLYRQALEIVIREGKASTSFIQRHLQIGYNRAARIIEDMEKRGVVSRANHVGKREVLISDVREGL